MEDYWRFRPQKGKRRRTAGGAPPTVGRPWWGKGILKRRQCRSLEQARFLHFKDCLFHTFESLDSREARGHKRVRIRIGSRDSQTTASGHYPQIRPHLKVFNLRRRKKPQVRVILRGKIIYIYISHVKLLSYEIIFLLRPQKLLRLKIHGNSIL